MLKLPFEPRYSLAPASLLLLCAVLYFLEPSSGQYLGYDRALIENGEIWRLLSANLVHTNFNHLLLNGVGLTLLWAIHGHYYQAPSYLFVILASSIFCTLAIFIFSPDLHWYVGLSGTLHAMFVVGAYFDIRHGLKSGWLLLIGVWAKIAHEQYFGASNEIAELINAKVAIDAHLYGAIAGMMFIAYFYNQFRSEVAT